MLTRLLKPSDANATSKILLCAGRFLVAARQQQNGAGYCIANRARSPIACRRMTGMTFVAAFPRLDYLVLHVQRPAAKGDAHHSQPQRIEISYKLRNLKPGNVSDNFWRRGKQSSLPSAIR
jgi:hypothetical protein